MNYFEKVTVNAQAINWLKEKYPELCIKAGLCERIGGRLYTKTFIDPPAPQQQAEPTQKPIGWLDGDETLAEFMHKDLKAAHDRCGSATPREFTIPVYLAPPAAQQRKPLSDEIVRLAGVALHEMPRPRTDWHSAAKLVCEAVVAHNIKEGTHD
jgi:hypothetical protein